MIQPGNQGVVGTSCMGTKRQGVAMNSTHVYDDQGKSIGHDGSV